jgi:hypothetical protein
VQCGAIAEGAAAGWRAYLVDLRDEGEPLEVVLFCPECAAAEFGLGD